MQKKKLYLFLPAKGPINGAKVVSNNIIDQLGEVWSGNIIHVDTAQAKTSISYGQLDMFKVISSLKLIFKAMLVDSNAYALVNLTPHGFAFYRDVLLVKVLNLKGVNVTAHVHANKLELQRNWLEKLNLNKVKFLVLNPSQKKALDKFFQNTYVLGNSLPEVNGTITSKRNPHQLLFFSNLSYEKGFDKLVYLTELIAKENLPFTITVCGNILDEKIKKDFYDLLDNYSFLEYKGVVSSLAEKKRLMEESAALLFLSDPYYEVFPLVYIEALSSGLPIISSPQYVAPDIIQGNGYIFHGSEGLIQAVKDLLLDPELHSQYSEKSRALYRTKFNFDIYLKNLTQVILKTNE